MQLFIMMKLLLILTFAYKIALIDSYKYFRKMKFPGIQDIPSQLVSEPSQTDLKYMDDYENHPSHENLQASMVNAVRDNQSLKKKESRKAQNISTKISKKKPLTKEQKGSSQNNGIQIKRNQSHNRGSNLNYTKLYSKKSSEFRQVKFSQFQFIYKTFSMFSSQHITFNELVLGLKSLGVEIETEKKFQAVKNIYEEFVGKNDVGVDFEMFAKVAIRLLKDERNKQNSDLLHIEKGFYYMVQEVNKVKWPFNKQEQEKYSQKDLFNEFKTYVDRLPSQKKYLNKESLMHLAKYLGMEKQLTPKDIETIIKFGDKQEKGHLSLEDVMRCIHGNKTVDV